MFVIQTKNKIQLTCGSRSLFVWCVLQLLSWLRQGGRSMETNNGGVTAMHLGTASVGIFIILSPCIKLDVLARLIRSKSHSVDCNELIRLSKSCSVDTLRKEAGWDLVPSASAIKKNPPQIYVTSWYLSQRTGPSTFYYCSQALTRWCQISLWEFWV